MLNRDAIEKIEEMVQCPEFITEVDGVQFHVNSKGASAVKFPEPDQMDVFSLSQLVELIKNCHSQYDGLIVNIDDFDVVSVVEKEFNNNGKRATVAVADFSEVFDKFPFGQQLSQEDFIIKLMTQFEKDGNRNELIKTVLSIKSEKVSTSDDDGYSQVAAVKAGVHLQAEKKVENLWSLVTYRTFPEVEQPTIPYILRLHQRDSEMPKFALYPCDGGKWKVDLTLRIREWLSTRLKVEVGEAYGQSVVVL